MKDSPETPPRFVPKIVASRPSAEERGYGRQPNGDFIVCPEAVAILGRDLLDQIVSGAIDIDALKYQLALDEQHKADHLALVADNTAAMKQEK
ncbi:hypothetical protein [Ferrovibrio sp.]|uniref:hypothetical protein n=1 Tax=Ferrovibrio sp. TaxID=1917215 RepID=UPI00311D5CC2